jgi:MSHA pilin protein MshD
VISIVIMSIALWAVVLGITTMLRHNTDPLLLQQAIAVAESYLEEVLNKNFPVLPCGAPAAGGRSVYTSICDYQNLTNVGAQNQDGTPIPGLQNYTVQVTIDTSTPVLGNLNSNAQVVRVDVNVTDPHNNSLTLSGYKTNH